MTERAKHLLEAFNELSEEEQAECAHAIIKRHALISLKEAFARINARQDGLPPLSEQELQDICHQLRKEAAAHADHH